MNDEDAGWVLLAAHISDAPSTVFCYLIAWHLLAPVGTC